MLPTTQVKTSCGECTLVHAWYQPTRMAIPTLQSPAVATSICDLVCCRHAQAYALRTHSPVCHSCGCRRQERARWGTGVCDTGGVCRWKSVLPTRLRQLQRGSERFWQPRALGWLPCAGVSRHCGCRRPPCTSSLVQRQKESTDILELY